MITTVAVRGYRSLRDVVLPLSPLTVVTGGNGVGKTSLYRALALIPEAARGRLVRALAESGGLPSVLWAGPETISAAMRRGDVPVEGTASRHAPISLGLGFASDDLGYLVDVGLPAGRSPRDTLFYRDPHVKRESIFAGPVARPATILVSRRRGELRRDGERVGVPIDDDASILDELAAPDAYPEVGRLRREVLSWRFYDSFRTDAGAPARAASVATKTTSLAADGSDLASAVATIAESAWWEPLEVAIADAFDGAELVVEEQLGRLALSMRQPGMLRLLAAPEWSDGTLRFVLLATALLSPSPPGLLVLNEPEASLHPQMLGALARLILDASRRAQVLVITHSEALASALDADGVGQVTLAKRLGETIVEGQGLLTRPTWDWGRR